MTKGERRAREELQARWGDELALSTNLALLGLEDVEALRDRLRDAWGEGETEDDRGRRLLDLRGVPLIQPARMHVREAHLGLARGVTWTEPLMAAYHSYIRRAGRVGVRRLHVDAEVTDCVLDAISIPEGRLEGTFVGCSFRGANLRRVDFGSSIRLTQCDFSGADMTRSKLWGDPARLLLFPPRYVDVCFSHVQFARSRICNVPFLRCSFENATMDFASLERSRFVSCNMRGVRGRQVYGSENRLEDTDAPALELRFPDEPLWFREQ